MAHLLGLHVALCPQGTYFFGGSGPLTWTPDVKYLAGFLLTPHWETRGESLRLRRLSHLSSPYLEGALVNYLGRQAEVRARGGVCVGVMLGLCLQEVEKPIELIQRTRELESRELC